MGRSQTVSEFGAKHLRESAKHDLESRIEVGRS